MTTTNNNIRISLTVPVKCSDCIYFSKATHQDFTGRCKDLGVEAYSSACKKYTPDFSILADDAIPILQIAKIARNMDESQLRIMSFIFRNASKIFRNGFKFGQPVFFNLSAPSVEFLDCYYSGCVIGIDQRSGEEMLVIAGLDVINGNQQRIKGALITMSPKSVMTKTQFNHHRDELVARNLLKSPVANHPISASGLPKHSKKTHLIDDIPTLDTVDPSWFDKIRDEEDGGKKKRTPNRIKGIDDKFKIM